MFDGGDEIVLDRPGPDQLRREGDGLHGRITHPAGANQVRREIILNCPLVPVNFKMVRRWECGHATELEDAFRPVFKLGEDVDDIRDAHLVMVALAIDDPAPGSYGADGAEPAEEHFGVNAQRQNV